MIRRFIDKKLNNFEESCNLFDLHPNPAPLQRSYKALCLCGRLTYVYNKERAGGICDVCAQQFKRSKL